MIFYIEQLIFSYLSTIGFSILFNSPKNCILKASICGTTGWMINVTILKFANSPVLGTFLGAFVVGILGEAFAKKFRQPATIFIVPGVIPLVPGAGIYFTMLYVVKEDFTKVGDYALQTVGTSIAIAVAIILSSSLNKMIKKTSYDKVKKS